MSQWLRPGEQFPIVWQASDPTDNNNYFPQYKIQNARTLATIQTLTLTNQGNQLYSTNFLVPQDSSGMGFYLTGTLRVFTDVNQTMLSQNYQIENRVYLVQSRPRVNYAGDGKDYDYLGQVEQIRKLLVAELKKLPSGIQKDEVAALLSQHLSDTLLKIPKTEFPKIEKYPELERIPIVEQAIIKIVDTLSSHGNKTNDNIRQVIDKLGNHEMSLNEIKGVHDVMGKHHEDTVRIVKEYAGQMQHYVDDQLKKFSKEMHGAMDEAFSGIEYVQISKEKGLKRMEKTSPKNDYMALAERLL